MLMKKSLVALMMILILSIGLFGCGNDSQVETQNVKGETDEINVVDKQSENTEGDIEETNSITDELGREVIIPENPERILGLTSAVMQALYNIDVIPVGKVEDYKVSTEGVALPSVGKSDNINIEAIYALEPDLIIASSRFHASLEEELENTGAVVYYFDPDKVGDIPVVEVTAYIGKLIGKQDIGEQYVQSVFESAEEFAQKIADETDIKTGIIIQEGDTILAAQNASSYGSMLKMLGIENIVSDNLPNAKKSSFVSFDVETILANNPDIIFIMTNSKDEENNKEIFKKFKTDSQWATMDAVQNNQLIILPFSVNPNRSTPEKMVKVMTEKIFEATEK